MLKRIARCWYYIIMIKTKLLSRKLSFNMNIAATHKQLLQILKKDNFLILKPSSVLLNNIFFSSWSYFNGIKQSYFLKQQSLKVKRNANLKQPFSFHFRPRFHAGKNKANQKGGLKKKEKKL